jgi:predicted small lipoprotein YifL
MRSLLVFILAATALTSLAACGNDPPSPAPTSTSTNDPEPAATGDPNVCNGEKPIQTGDGRYVCP